VAVNLQSTWSAILEGLFMRLLTIGILAASLAAVGCERAETAASSTAPASDAAAPAKADAAKPAASSATAAPAAAPAAAATFREITIPAGTVLPVTLDTSVGSDISRDEQAVSGHLSRPLVIGGETAVPAGSRVTGVVTDATRSAKVKGRAHVALRFDSLTAHDERYRIETAAIGRTAAATKKDDAMKIGGPAAGGAIIGAIAGGKKGAAIGTAVGGGAGTAVVLSTRGKEVRLAKGSAVSVKLTEPLTVRLR
jgi:hypothetical protein